MSTSCDFLGREWSHDKLDRLLADPSVMAAVEEIDIAGRTSRRKRSFDSSRARAWAEAKGRSEPAFALLLLLRARWFSVNGGRLA